MKTIRLFFVLTSALSLFGCSSNEDESVSGPEVSSISTLEIFWGGVSYGQDTLNVDFRAAKIEHLFRFESGFFSFSFDENGHFGTMEATANPGHSQSTQYFHSYRAFSSNQVNFQLISVDTINKRIKGSFSGYVYHDPFNINSEGAFASGTFDMLYSDNVPVIKNYGVKAKINNADWIYTDWYSGQSSQPLYFSDHYISDDPYKIMIDYNSGTNVGVYNFTPSDVVSKVRLSKYNTATNTYVDYLCTGTMNVTEHQQNLYRGTFSFTAVNPQNTSDVIQVTDGQFATRKTF